ncbi:unnamed protein product [Effrenium voratum]|nr:unnamed protein product [Effrenium voratum]
MHDHKVQSLSFNRLRGYKCGLALDAHLCNECCVASYFQRLFHSFCWSAGCLGLLSGKDCLSVNEGVQHDNFLKLFNVQLRMISGICRKHIRLFRAQVAMAIAALQPGHGRWACWLLKAST